MPNAPVSIPAPAEGSTTADIAKNLQRLEDKTFGGLATRSTKRRNLEAPGEVARAHPANKGYHIRWSQDQKTDSRKDDGYEVIPESEGGCRKGDLCLMRLRQDAADARNAQINETNRAVLNVDSAAHMRTAEELSRTLREQGIHRSPKQLTSFDND